MKKATIIQLVPESTEKTNAQLEKEIQKGIAGEYIATASFANSDKFCIFSQQGVSAY